MLGNILFITSRYGGLPQGLLNTLRRMQTAYTEVPLWRMQEAYENFHPSVMIFFHQNYAEWDQTIAKEVESLHCHKWAWDWEMPWQLDEIIPYHHLFGKILVQDKSSKLALENRMNDKVVFVPHAADPESNPHMETVPFAYRSDLCFIGAAYPSRIRFFRAVLPHLTEYKVVIGGGGYEFLPNTEGQYVPQRAIVGDDYIKYTNGAKIVLNLHRGSDELTMHNTEHVKASSPNNRFFEVNMMGKFQMTDRLRAPELFDYYPKTATFDTPEEFIKQFRTWIRDDEGRSQMGKEAREHSLHFHTYEKRFADILAPLL